MSKKAGKTCKGTTKNGSKCRSGAPQDSDFCHMHQAQARQVDEQLAQVVEIRDRLQDPELGLSSREERMRWLDMVWKGEVGDVRVLPTGKTKKIPASMKDRQEALKQLERMQHHDDDTDDLLESLADRVRDRLGI